MFARLFAPTVEVSAHCDLPCGVYDPAQARIEAESVKAIIEKVADNDDPDFRTRAILIKEQRSELVKHHLWVLWTDYFKPPHFEKYPQLHTLVNEATKLAGASGTKGRAGRRPRPTSCSPRSTRSPRSSGRPRRPELTGQPCADSPERPAHRGRSAMCRPAREASYRSRERRHCQRSTRPQATTGGQRPTSSCGCRPTARTSSVLRTATAGLAARLDFTLDDIEDLRIAVGEACAMVLGRPTQGADLTARFDLEPGG